MAATKANDADPEAVALLPRLNDTFGLTYADFFTSQLCDYIADYQRSVGLLADGQLGPKTRAKLAAQKFLDGEECGAVWPYQPEREYTHWKQVARALGYGISSRPVLLVIRGAYPFARRTHRMIFAPRLDDCGVLIDTKLGGPNPYVFRLSSHAYQLSSGASPDLDRDGVGDVGSIRPGHYILHQLAATTYHVKMPDGSDRIPCWRDTSHDGLISEVEAERAESATTGPQVTPGVGMWANAVLVHESYTSGRSSISCITTETREFGRLRAAGKTIDMLLANARDVARAVHPAEPFPLPPKANS
jgi:hypothetical protein